MKTITTTVLFLVLILVSCKYDEGPSISFRTHEKRMSGKWEIEYMKFNGSPVSIPSNKTITLQYDYDFVNDSPIVSKPYGIWSFNGSFTYLEFYENVSLSSIIIRYEILRLKNKSVWISNNEYEYHLKLIEKL